eukprot:g17523.t1
MAKPRQGANSSNDKPSFAYNVPSMDDGSIQRVIKSIAPVVPRNYVVMEVKSNLVKEERLETLKHFNTPNFKKVALVIMGEPDLDFKQKSYTSLLEKKKVFRTKPLSDVLPTTLGRFLDRFTLPDTGQ